MNKLDEWDALGLIEIVRTSTLTEELERNLGPAGQARREKAQAYREGSKSRAFTLRKPGGGSTQRGGDTLRGPKASHSIQPIAAIIFPRRRFEQLSLTQQGDVLHLAEHKIHGWDYFVTRNSRDFFPDREALRGLGIVVFSPEEAVEEIARVVASRIFGPSRP